MSEWIEKEEVLKQIDCWFTTGEYKYSNATHYLNKRISSIKPKESEWVSVKDRLPEEDGYYLVYIIANFCSENKQIITLYFSKLSKRFIYGSDEIFTVTHWVQLPEPPESEDDVK